MTKKSEGDRDASVDRLLAGTLKARPGALAAGVCLDVETLAAWADGALDASERATAEAHAADCAHCQAMLAAMVRTMPAAEDARSWWRMPALGWLVPLTAAAAALAIWIAVPNRSVVQQSDHGAVAVDQATPATPAQAKSQAGSAPQHRVAKEQDAPGPPAVDVRERRDAPARAQQAASADALADSANVAPAAPLARSAPAAPPPSAAQSSMRALSAPARVSTFAGGIEPIIVSSNPATRFRLLPGGGVQRSADGGATWRTEATGATATLTTGASPSPSVCWLIGPAGTVLLSTDGRSWRRVAFPAPVDLTAIIATDGETATVTTADARTFVTADGGQTWALVPAP